MAQQFLFFCFRFENDKYSKVPLFIFGDFNFRLDSYMLIKVKAVLISVLLCQICSGFIFLDR